MIRKYIRGGVAAAALASMLGCTSPDLQANCPDPKQARNLVPDYNPGNAVASAGVYIDLYTIIGGERVRAGMEYPLIVYNSKSKNNRIIEYESREGFERFLESGEFDVVELREMNNLHQIHNKPSAVVYKTENITYVLLDLKGQNDLADSNPDYSDCFEGWQPSLLIEVGQRILKKRLEDIIKKDYPPQNPKPKVLKIA